MNLLRRDIHPSKFNYRGGWTRIVECSRCHLWARKEDLPSSEPCWRCGTEGNLHEHIGRWISSKKWYNPMTWKTGIWKIKQVGSESWDEKSRCQFIEQDW